MDNYERRRQLLSQSGKKGFYPVKNESQPSEKSSLGIRITLAALFFIGYVLLDYGKISVYTINTQTIRQEIQQQMQLQTITTWWDSFCL